MTAARGFPKGEFLDRLARAQARMAAHDLSALLLTTEPEIRYFSGYLTRFWESPSRTWFLIIPASGDPVAVIPAIGVPLMARGWISDIRSWPAPDPDNDGTTLLADTLREIAGRGGRIGVPSGPESHLRMPLAEADALRSKLAAHQLASDQGIVAGLRAIKSAREIDKIAATCAVANRAFGRVPEIARAGVPLEQVFRDFQRLLLEEGADWVPYLAGAASRGGYDDVISPASGDPLQQGDVLMLDTGATRDGYFCDFDRNFSIGPAAPAIRDAHARLIDATAAACDAATPGATAADLHRAMQQVLGARTGAGRLGHGLGMQLTEGLSLLPNDHTELRPGMVITLEPGIMLENGKMLVHEENIAIETGPPRKLSDFAGPDIPVLV